MNRDEVIAILEMPRDQAIEKILLLAEKAEKYDREHPDNPTTPSGMKPVYLKPNARKRRKKPGRPPGHAGAARPKPETIDDFKEHTLSYCPDCQTPLAQPIKRYQRCIEDIPEVKPRVTEHTVNGYWCSTCKKIVWANVADALPNCMVGLRLVVFTAWLHYLVGVSVNNIVAMVSVFADFKITAGGLTLAWRNLARYLESAYDDIGDNIAQSAVLHADETGWRLSGLTHWLWCFATKTHCYYIITRGRGSPVVKQVLGIFFKGILICDFWGAYNKISALAHQRCFFHLFTELVKVDKYNRSSDWQAFRKKLSRLLKDAVRLSENRMKVPERFEDRKTRLYRRLEDLIQIGSADNDVCRLIKRLKRHQDQLFTFLEYPDVSPYNNHAEQQMRKAVLCRRVSQQNRSEQGAKTQAILMSLFRTAELQGLNPLESVFSSAQRTIEKSERSQINYKKAA